MTNVARVNRRLDEISSAWMDGFQVVREIEDLMDLFPELNWIEVLKAANVRQKKRHPDSDRIATAMKMLSPRLLGF